MTFFLLKTTKNATKLAKNVTQIQSQREFSLVRMGGWGDDQNVKMV